MQKNAQVKSSQTVKFRPIWSNCLPGTSALSYLASSSVTKKKSFCNIDDCSSKIRIERRHRRRQKRRVRSVQHHVVALVVNGLNEAEGEAAGAETVVLRRRKVVKVKVSESVAFSGRNRDARRHSRIARVTFSEKTNQSRLEAS
jgi:hypothetical protein